MITKEDFEKLKVGIFKESKEEDPNEERIYYRKEFNKEALEKHYRGGATIKRIAKMYDYSQVFIKQKLEDWKISLRSTDTTWRSGGQDSGYVTIHINGQAYPEHRYVWEQIHGPLPKRWIVHHLNGIKNLNYPENLVGMPRNKHGIDQLHPAFEKRILSLEKEVKELKDLVQVYEDYIRNA